MLELEGEFKVSRCADCGLLFQNPRIPPELLTKHYPNDYGPYAGKEMQVGKAALRELRRHRGYSHLESPRATLKWMWAWMRPWSAPWGRYTTETLLLPHFVPGGRLLEIACASGARLSLLRRLGWTHCSGIELNETAALRARDRGFPVRSGKVETLLDEIPDASLDVVIAGFVLEHLENPFETVRQIAAKLKPGGQFLFSTLDIESPDFRLYGKYWYNLDLPRHHVFFRKRDLMKMVEGGFRIEKLTRIAAPNDYVGSARYRLRYAPRIYDAILARARNRILPLCLALAALGLSSRVALRCRRSQGIAGERP